jgi:hypothetical protein
MVGLSSLNARMGTSGRSTRAPAIARCRKTTLIIAGCVTASPKTGRLHVDKNGNTCAAGAGSIITGKWHGFLHNG